MNYQILPSILAADHGKFVPEALTVDIPEVEYLHIDVMDGHFVPNISFGPTVVRSLKSHTRFKLDVHLMIDNVDQYVPAFAKAGADNIIIHQEATRHLHRSLLLIRECGAKVGVAINPATPLTAIEWVLPIVDQVLIMSVNPGFGGQKFIDISLQKLRRLLEIREENSYKFIIEVDGGIDKRTAPEAVSAGAEYLVAGSAIFKHKDRPKAIHSIKQEIETHLNRKRVIFT